MNKNQVRVDGTQSFTRRDLLGCLLGASSCLDHVLAQTSVVTEQPLRLATGYRLDSFQTQNLTQFAAVLASSGVQMVLHPNNTLFKLADIPDAVREGKVQFGETIMSNLVKLIPIAGADAVPFIVRSYADALRLWANQRAGIENEFASLGLTPLMAVPWPPQCLYSKKPVRRISDLSGSKMRTASATTRRIAQLIGATSVDVPMVGVKQALAEGRFDSMITSAVTGVENEVWSHMPYFYPINAWYPKNITFANTRALKALPDAAQAAIFVAAKEAENKGWVASEYNANESVEQLRVRGTKVQKAGREIFFGMGAGGWQQSQQHFYSLLQPEMT
jgi:TRAP-type transport system periplasmic protein